MKPNSSGIRPLYLVKSPISKNVLKNSHVEHLYPEYFAADVSFRFKCENLIKQKALDTKIT